MPVMNKQVPEITEAEKKLPQETKLDKVVPEPTEKEKALPPTVNPENVIKLGDEEIEIKPTKLKYQRNRTAAAYRILELYPLPDVLAMNAGALDPDRDGDQVVFDFLTAVFDDGKLVQKYYDSMTTEDIERILKIFKRLNAITDKEEKAKNLKAKETSR